MSKRSHPVSLQDYLARYTRKDKDSKPTHTRIPDKKGSGGSWIIPDTQFDKFMEKYFSDIIVDNNTDHLTEKQLEDNGQDNGPIAIDFDFHFPTDVKEHQVTKDHIDLLIRKFLDCLKNIVFQLSEEEEPFNIFIMQKKEVNPVQEKTKDGIHMIIGIKLSRVCQMELRRIMLPSIEEIFGDIGIINSWDTVYDKSITSGNTNWQLYGSCKPNHDVYRLTYVYNITVEDCEFHVDDSCDPQEFLKTVENFKKLSVRYTKHPSLFVRDSFLHAMRTPPINTSTQRSNVDFPYDHLELDQIVTNYLGSLPTGSFKTTNILKAYEYVMILPSKYYDEENAWIRVGWALKNTCDESFWIWMQFSAKSSTQFYFSDVSDYKNNWENWVKPPTPVTLGSFIKWAQDDANPEDLERVSKKWNRKPSAQTPSAQDGAPLTLDILEKNEEAVSQFFATNCEELVYCDTF